VKAVPGGIKAKTCYADRPEGWSGPWLPDAVWSMTRQGILKGKSIGFIPTKMRPPAPDEAHWKNANAVIESAVLLEYAVAPVPVNQDALVEAVAKGYADEETLRKLGLLAPARKKLGATVDEVALFLKALEKVRIDPNRIAAKILDKYKNRGKV
jgi:hypothetical protein